MFFWQQDPHAAEVGYGEKAVGQVAPQLPHFTHQILPTQSHGPTTHSSANLAIRASLSLHLALNSPAQAICEFVVVSSHRIIPHVPFANKYTLA